MGLQLAGPVNADLAVLGAGQAYDEACPWSALRPPVPASLAD